MLSSRLVALRTDLQYHFVKAPARMKSHGENSGTAGTVLNRSEEIAQCTPSHLATQRVQVLWILHSTIFNPTRCIDSHKHRKQSFMLTTGPGRPLGDNAPFPNRVAGTQFHTPAPRAKFPVLTSLDTQSLLEASKPVRVQPESPYVCQRVALERV